MDSKPNYFNVSIEDSEILNNCTIKNLVINIAVELNENAEEPAHSTERSLHYV